MEHPRHTKANLHPTAPVLEAKQKQCTSAQKATDVVLIQEQVDKAAQKMAEEHAVIVNKIAKRLLLTTTTSQFSHAQDTPKNSQKTKPPTVAPTSLLRGAIDPPWNLVHAPTQYAD